MRLTPFLLAFSFYYFSTAAYAKTCTEDTIRKTIKDKKRFDFDEERCDDEVVYIRKGIQLNGNIIIHGKNRLRLSWKGEGSQCDEKPRGDAFATFYTKGNKNIIRNLSILKSPEGIHLSEGKGNIVQNVIFERICEDAITNGNKRSSSATDSLIIDSVFKNGPDKAIQCNGGSVTVKNSEFSNIPRSIGACTFKADPGFHEAKECPIPCTIHAVNNDVYGCGGYAFRGAGYLQGKKEGSLFAIGNRFHDCKDPLIASQYGFIYAEDNEVFGSCSQLIKSEERSSGEYCDNETSRCRNISKGSSVRQNCRDIKIPGDSSPSKPNPPVAEPPQQQKEIVNFELFSTGMFEYSLDRELQERIACSRAENEVFKQTRSKCSEARGRILEHQETCVSCLTIGKGVKCEAK